MAIESEFEMTGRRMQDIHAKGKTAKRVRDCVVGDVCLWCGEKIDREAGQESKRGIHVTPCHGRFSMLILGTAETKRATKERELITDGKILEPHSKLARDQAIQRRKMAKSAAKLSTDQKAEGAA